MAPDGLANIAIDLEGSGGGDDERVILGANFARTVLDGDELCWFIFVAAGFVLYGSSGCFCGRGRRRASVVLVGIPLTGVILGIIHHFCSWGGGGECVGLGAVRRTLGENMTRMSGRYLWTMSHQVRLKEGMLCVLFRHVLSEWGDDGTY